MWRLDGKTASVASTHVALRLNLSDGDHSVLLGDSSGTQLASLWGLQSLAGLPLTDAYVRGNDLVATYGPGQEFPFYTQVYWTLQSLACRPAPLLAMSLLVSVRTDLLDSHPEFDVVTRMPPRQALDVASFAGGQLFWSSVNSAATLVDFARDADCASQRLVKTEGDVQVIERRLFSDFLEKGVIRRARLFAAVAPPDITEAEAADLCKEFAGSAMPLTA